MPARAELLLEIADDELILGWRDSEWTGIAPFLEEDVAFSSIAQNEIGHARALYELVAHDLGTTADELAFDRAPDEYRCSTLVALRLVPDWARTIARRYLYEVADELRLGVLKGSDDPEVAGLAPPAPRAAGAPTLVELRTAVFRCPYCGSTDTKLENVFGPTPCRSLRYCATCCQPFEQFKTL